MNAQRATFIVAAVIGIVACASAALVPLTSPIGLAPGDTPATVTVYALVGLLWLAACLVTLARQPANPLWMLILGMLVWSRFLWALQFTVYPVIQALAVHLAPLWIVMYVHVLVAYPTGRLRTRYDRGLVAAVYAVELGLALVAFVMWQPPTTGCPPWCPENVLLLWPNNELSGLLGRASQLTAPIFGAAAVWAIWRHWRAAGPAGRRVLLPVAVTVPIAYGVHATGYVASALGSPGFGDVGHWAQLIVDALVPLGLLLGVLRLRLGRGRVADLVVELGRGVPAGGLREVLARALGDPTLQLAFATPDGRTYIDGAGHAVEVPGNEPGRAVARIERDGEPLAVLVHDPAIDDEDPSLVDAVSSAARLAIENERLTAQVRAQLEEVRASRVRIVEAADEERRKVERDLHDGAQQRLVALTMRLEQARTTAEGSARLIDETTSELREAIAEVRGLARGLYPPILAEAGLAAAVESLAERSTLPVEVRIPEARFPRAVEITAYFVVSEALTNVSRYAGATMARVVAGVENDVLTVTITDDGRGGADPDQGTGLKGLDDRVAAIGGRLDVRSVPGSGTTVAVQLPLGGGGR
jgi:signal transduction histidine kinase